MNDTSMNDIMMMQWYTHSIKEEFDKPGGGVVRKSDITVSPEAVRRKKWVSVFIFGCIMTRLPFLLATVYHVSMKFGHESLPQHVAKLVSENERLGRGV